MILEGESSGAIATINDVKLLSDVSAFCGGSFFIPNPNNINFPRFETGTKTFTLIDDADNNQDKCNTLTDETYTAAGTLETVQRIFFLLEMQELSKDKNSKRR